MKNNISLCALFLFFFCPAIAWANNLSLQHFDASLQNRSTHTMSFTFDLAQANSWKNATSHDAVWLFMKYSTDAGQTWHHATMGGVGRNPAGFIVPSGFETLVPADSKGFFLRRAVSGTGDLDLKGVNFVWNYSADSLTDDVAAAANTLTRIYGVEMVYVPDGAFFAGDGVSSSEFRFKSGSAEDSPWYIANENAIATTSLASGSFYYQGTGGSGENNSGDAFLIPNSFPKGYRSFYLMKYELTEGQWIAFMNALPSSVRVNRDITSSVDGGKSSQGVVRRNTVAWDSSTPGTKVTTQRPDRAMTYISWPDVAAYADWAALRPLTELEFEKAARGSDITPVADEYVWGTAAYTAAGTEEIFPPAQNEDGTETILNGAANLNRNLLGWNSGDSRLGGPAQGQEGALRSGIFARSTSSRVTSGAGYYGNMDLSGNVAEPVVSVGRSEGRQFLGTHGDGELSSTSGYEGNATNVDWPGIDPVNAARGVNGTVGIGYRGGDYAASNLRVFQLSSRTFAAKDPDSQGFTKRFDSSYGVRTGGRLARTAP